MLAIGVELYANAVATVLSGVTRRGQSTATTHAPSARVRALVARIATIATVVGIGIGIDTPTVFIALPLRIENIAALSKRIALESHAALWSDTNAGLRRIALRTHRTHLTTVPAMQIARQLDTSLALYPHIATLLVLKGPADVDSRATHAVL